MEIEIIKSVNVRLNKICVLRKLYSYERDYEENRSGIQETFSIYKKEKKIVDKKNIWNETCLPSYGYTLNLQPN